MEYLVIIGGGEARWTSAGGRLMDLPFFSSSTFFRNIDIRHVLGRRCVPGNVEEKADTLILLLCIFFAVQELCSF